LVLVAVSCDWEGNRRCGVALAMCHRLKWFIHLRAPGLSKGDEHPTNTPHEIWGMVLFTFVGDTGSGKGLIFAVWCQCLEFPSVP